MRLLPVTKLSVKMRRSGMVTKMDQQTIEFIAEAVAERILRELPRGRVSVTPEYLTPDQVSQMMGFSLKALRAFFCPSRDKGLSRSPTVPFATGISGKLCCGPTKNVVRSLGFG